MRLGHLAKFNSSADFGSILVSQVLAWSTAKSAASRSIRCCDREGLRGIEFRGRRRDFPWKHRYRLVLDSRAGRSEMGKRKSAKPPPKKGQEKLATTFNCPFCNHEKSVECVMDRKARTGEAKCRICMESFKTPIDALSDPVDVYSDWIDECERANNGE